MDSQEISAHSWLDHPATYQIVVEGRLDQSWAEWFDGLSEVTQEDAGTVFTALTGPVADRGALQGILARVRNLSIPLLEVRRLENGGDSTTAGNENKP